jgi:hypothetical protein
MQGLLKALRKRTNGNGKGADEVEPRHVQVPSFAASSEGRLGSSHDPEPSTDFVPEAVAPHSPELPPEFAPEVRTELNLARYARDWILPAPAAEPDEQPFVPRGVLGCPEVEAALPGQLALLDSWRSMRHQALFALLRNDPAINTLRLGEAALHNNYYPTPDAEIYAAMILDRKPGRIIEVGSGFSTLVARAAINFCGYDTRIVVIDPCPRTDVHAAADEVILSPVENSALAQFAWSSDDLLFIDSSHICRARGDLPCLFCRVVPALPSGMTVHVHDVFLPFDYPNNYDERGYTEQYLLHCLLQASHRYRTLLATHWLSRQHGSSVRSVFGEAVGHDPLYFGASFWFSVKGG